MAQAWRLTLGAVATAATTATDLLAQTRWFHAVTVVVVAAVCACSYNVVVVAVVALRLRFFIFIFCRSLLSLSLGHAKTDPAADAKRNE